MSTHNTWATPWLASRRSVLAHAFATAVAAAFSRAAAAAEQAVSGFTPERRWYEAALGMERLALSWGDQPYGAVLVAGATIIGNGPSRVVLLGDPSAHAERVAIRDAQRRLGRYGAQGAVLYSTSRPCRACETAAAEAGIARMVFGPDLTDGGAPRR